MSVSARGEEVRVWELEGGKGKGERNVKVEKAWYAEPVDGDHGEEIGLATALGGFDEQMVVFVKIMASPSSSPVVVNGRRKMADMSLVETGTMSRNGDSPAAATKHAGNGQPSAPTADFDINGIDDDVDDESFDHQHQCTNTSSSSVGAGNVTNYPVRTSTRTALVVYDFTR